MCPIDYGNMPQTYEEFLEIVKKGDTKAEQLIADLQGWIKCARDGTDMVDIELLEEQVSEYYKLEEAKGLDHTITHSGLSIPHPEHSGFCFYCGEILEKDK